ncbi:rod shape-determining protein MreD [Blastomonas sp.]|uniref:rod shape-determining protein MreD n=1 Tax=Blastomonas sp. TaxID=1909299 RepID=UPI003592ED57
MNAPYRARLNRVASPFRKAAVPIASVIIGSLTPLLPIISSAPVLPPFGLIILISWQMLRPGIWPVWAGVPFGMIDDVFSGQPVGSAVLLWSLVLIALDLIEQRYMWRNYWQDWFIAMVMLILALAGGLAINTFLVSDMRVSILFPQMILTVALYPLVLRLVARLDHLRLNR